jgi:hypothetical protein
MPPGIQTHINVLLNCAGEYTAEEVKAATALWMFFVFELRFSDGVVIVINGPVLLKLLPSVSGQCTNQNHLSTLQLLLCFRFASISLAYSPLCPCSRSVIALPISELETQSVFTGSRVTAALLWQAVRYEVEMRRGETRKGVRVKQIWSSGGAQMGAWKFGLCR